MTQSHDCKIVILYDHPIWTDCAFIEYNGPPNRPDIIVQKEKETLLIDVAIPANSNIRKETENKLRDQIVAIEMRCMWITKFTIMPVIIGYEWFISKELTKFVNQIPGQQSASELQKTAILGTAHIFRQYFLENRTQQVFWTIIWCFTQIAWYGTGASRLTNTFLLILSVI